MQADIEINLDPRLRPDIELQVLPEQVSRERHGKQDLNQTTLREAAVTSATEPDHDSAMSEPSNQT